MHSMLKSSQESCRNHEICVLNSRLHTPQQGDAQPPLAQRRTLLLCDLRKLTCREGYWLLSHRRLVASGDAVRASECASNGQHTSTSASWYAMCTCTGCIRHALPPQAVCGASCNARQYLFAGESPAKFIVFTILLAGCVHLLC